MGPTDLAAAAAVMAEAAEAADAQPAGAALQPKGGKKRFEVKKVGARARRAARGMAVCRASMVDRMLTWNWFLGCLAVERRGALGMGYVRQHPRPPTTERKKKEKKKEEEQRGEKRYVRFH